MPSSVMQDSKPSLIFLPNCPKNIISRVKLTICSSYAKYSNNYLLSDCTIAHEEFISNICTFFSPTSLKSIQDKRSKSRADLSISYNLCWMKPYKIFLKFSSLNRQFLGTGCISFYGRRVTFSEEKIQRVRISTASG